MSSMSNRPSASSAGKASRTSASAPARSAGLPPQPQVMAVSGLLREALARAALWRTLTRRYAAETGLAFSAWRQRARLLRALELLAAGQAVTTVALELGYDSLSAFIALFRCVMGVSPGAWPARQAAAVQSK